MILFTHITPTYIYIDEVKAGKQAFTKKEAAAGWKETMPQQLFSYRDIGQKVLVKTADKQGI